MPSFELCSAHAGTHTFDNQIAFQLGNRTYDDEDGTAQRSGSIQVFPERDKLDVQMVEFVDGLEEVPDRAGQPITGPDQHDVELATAGIQSSSCPVALAGENRGAGDAISVALHNLQATLLGHEFEITQLRLRVLVDAGNSHIKRRAPHDCALFQRTFFCTLFCKVIDLGRSPSRDRKLKAQRAGLLQTLEQVLQAEVESILGEAMSFLAAERPMQVTQLRQVGVFHGQSAASARRPASR